MKFGLITIWLASQEVVPMADWPRLGFPSVSRKQLPTLFCHERSGGTFFSRLWLSLVQGSCGRRRNLWLQSTVCFACGVSCSGVSSWESFSMCTLSLGQSHLHSWDLRLRIGRIVGLCPFVCCLSLWAYELSLEVGWVALPCTTRNSLPLHLDFSHGISQFVLHLLGYSVGEGTGFRTCTWFVNCFSCTCLAF